MLQFKELNYHDWETEHKVLLRENERPIQWVEAYFSVELDKLIREVGGDCSDCNAALERLTKAFDSRYVALYSPVVGDGKLHLTAKRDTENAVLDAAFSFCCRTNEFLRRIPQGLA